MSADKNNPTELNQVVIVGNKPLLTIEQLKIIVPNLPRNGDVFLPYLNEFMRQYDIDTPKRIAAFIAQIAHESGGFRYTIEIASGDAYENRADLGNTFPGAGRKYKGRGLIQITGFFNYQRYGKRMGLDLVNFPELLQTPQYAVLSACLFWVDIKGNGLADLPDTWRSKTKRYTPFQYITFRVNGGQNGYTDRLKYYDQALDILV